MKKLIILLSFIFLINLISADCGFVEPVKPNSTVICAYNITSPISFYLTETVVFTLRDAEGQIIYSNEIPLAGITQGQMITARQTIKIPAFPNTGNWTWEYRIDCKIPFNIFCTIPTAGTEKTGSFTVHEGNIFDILLAPFIFGIPLLFIIGIPMIIAFLMIYFYVLVKV